MSRDYFEWIYIRRIGLDPIELNWEGRGRIPNKTECYNIWLAKQIGKYLKINIFYENNEVEIGVRNEHFCVLIFAYNYSLEIGVSDKCCVSACSDAISRLFSFHCL